MPRLPDCDAVYEVADQWRERCLKSDGSLLWPELEEATWTTTNLNAFVEAFIGHPDTSDKSFLEKWQKQLAACTDAVVRIAADSLAVYCLFPSETKAHTKSTLVNAVVDFRPQPSASTELLERAFGHGIGKVGTWYNTGRNWQVAFFAEFAKLLKEDSVDPDIYTAVKEVARQVFTDSGPNLSATHNMLVHLLFPDQTESISNDTMRLQIVRALGNPSAPGGDLDEQLRQIRNQLAPKFGPGHFNFYDPEVKILWDPATVPVIKPPDPKPPLPNGRRYWIF